MNNKLDYLAQKEEELRKLNEQLDQRKVLLLKENTTTTTNIISSQNALADSLDMRGTTAKGKNPFLQE
jgi:hypothetical protein